MNLLLEAVKEIYGEENVCHIYIMEIIDYMSILNIDAYI